MNKKYGPWTHCYHGVALKTKFEQEFGHSRTCRACVTQKVDGKIDVRSSVSRNYWEERKDKTLSPESVREMIEFMSMGAKLRNREIMNQISVTLKTNLDIPLAVEALKKIPNVEAVVQVFPRSKILVTDPDFERFIVLKTKADPKDIVKQVELTNLIEDIEIVPVRTAKKSKERKIW